MKEIKKISITEIGNELPFTVPENYFEHFALNIEEQIGVKTIWKHRSFYSWMFVAASFIGVFMLGQNFYNLYQDNQIEKSESYESFVLSQVNESAMIDYYTDEVTE